MPATDPLPATLRDILVCPVDHAALRVEENHLACPVCGRRYPVGDAGVPDLVVEEA